MEDNEEGIKKIKIVFMGSWNIGKSAIIKSFMENQIKTDTVATIDFNCIKLKFANTEFYIYDTGGAKGFLDRFLNELKEFIFTGVQILVYVVDSTNLKDLKKVRNYFEETIERLKTFSPDAKIFLFMHKCDLMPRDVPAEFDISNLGNEFTSYLFERVDPTYKSRNIRTYETSIFNKKLTKAMLDVFTTAVTGVFL